MFRRTCGDCRLLTLLQAGHGCSQHPAFPAPSLIQDGVHQRRTRAHRAARTRLAAHSAAWYRWQHTARGCI